MADRKPLPPGGAIALALIGAGMLLDAVASGGFVHLIVLGFLTLSAACGLALAGRRAS